MIAKALTIAGSDCSGGAGIQADLKTFAAHGVYGMSVITALTAQNTIGVQSILDVTIEMVRDQIDAVFSDIPPDVVKIGMVSVEETIHSISEGLRKYEPQYVVLDPVMVSTSGYHLLSPSAIKALKEELLPLATVITPNLKEAEVLCGHTIESESDILSAMDSISEMTSAAILIKGGHSLSNADDYLYDKGKITCFPGKRILNENTHGTGCTLSSAIASYLALGEDLHTSIEKGKAYITGALEQEFNLGTGSGPLNHMYQIGLND